MACNDLERLAEHARRGDDPSDYMSPRHAMDLVNLALAVWAMYPHDDGSHSPDMGDDVQQGVDAALHALIDATPLP